MALKHITTDKAPSAIGPYSQGVIANGFLYTAGQIALDPVVNANSVTVDVTYGVRDWSGNWDDDYTGDIEFAVIAEL